MRVVISVHFTCAHPKAELSPDLLFHLATDLPSSAMQSVGPHCPPDLVNAVLDGLQEKFTPGAF